MSPNVKALLFLQSAWSENMFASVHDGACVMVHVRSPFSM